MQARDREGGMKFYWKAFCFYSLLPESLAISTVMNKEKSQVLARVAWA